MGDYRQLKMVRDLTTPLPVLPPMPAGFTIHTDDGTCDKAWEWIIGASFGWDCSYDMIRNDQSCAPERVFFVREYSQDVATAAVQIRENVGTLHMVGIHPSGEGRGISKYVVHAAVQCMMDLGLAHVDLTTDDERLPAIKTYLDMGFVPVEDDEEMVERWAKVRENMAAFQKKPREIVELWPDGNIPYFEEGNCIPTLEAYPVEGAHGAVVVCPGGGYYIKASHEGVHIARMLNEAGIAAYVLDYRVHPCHYEAPLADALRAIRVVRAKGYEKVGILGFSAGGHLSCSAATLYTEGDADSEDPIERLSSRPDAFIPCYVVVSLVSEWKPANLSGLFGDKADDMALRERFSAQLHVDAHTPPAFIWHTMSDDVVSPKNALCLAEALYNASVPVALHIFPNGPHGLGLAGGVDNVSQWPKLCKSWLLSLGFGA